MNKSILGEKKLGSVTTKFWNMRTVRKFHCFTNACWQRKSHASNGFNDFMVVFCWCLQCTSWFSSIFIKLRSTVLDHTLHQTHRCISTVINFRTSKFCQHLLQNPLPLNINVNHVSYLMWQHHEQHTVRCQVSTFPDQHCT